MLAEEVVVQKACFRVSFGEVSLIHEDKGLKRNSLRAHTRVEFSADEKRYRPAKVSPWCGGYRIQPSGRPLNYIVLDNKNQPLSIIRRTAF